MDKCYYTKFKGTLEDDSLLKLNEMRIVITPLESGGHLYFDSGSYSMKYDFSNPVTVKDAGGNVLATDVVTYTKSADINIFPPVNEKTIVSVENKFNIKEMSTYVSGSRQIVDLEMAEVCYLSNIKDFRIIAKHLKGFDDINQLKGSPSIVRMFNITGNRKLTGNISIFEDYTSLQLVNIQGEKIEGVVYNTNINGDIESFKKSTNIRELSVGQTNVSGNADNLLNAYAQSGRTANLTLSINPEFVELTGKTSAMSYTIQFNSGMVNPTPEESARGWKIAT